MFDELKEWQFARCGKFTASEIWKLMTRGKAKDEYFGKPAMAYIKLKAAEILTQEPNNGGRLNTMAMEWGNAHEGEAVEVFQKRFPQYDVTHHGGGNPLYIPFTDWSGGSPDAFATNKETGERIVLEFKCPFNSAEHCEHIIYQTPEDLKADKPEYYWQVMAYCLFSGCENAKFISYDPRFCSDVLQLKILEMSITEEIKNELRERISEAEKQLKVFIDIIESSI